MIKLRFATVVVLLMVLAGFGAAPAHAGAAAIGSVAGTLNASVGGQALLPDAVIFSGDRLRVNDGAAVVALARGSRMAFGRETQASFLRDVQGVTVLLASGNVSLYHPASAEAVRVMAGNIEVRPVARYKSLGEVALSHGVILVTAKEGSLQVTGGGRAVKLTQGKSLCIRPGARAFPQGGPAASAGAPTTSGNSSDRDWRVVELAAGGTGVILGAVAVSQAGSSNSTAKSALSTAQAAASSASAAASAATAAANAATAATAAAAVATSVAVESATLAAIDDNLIGCKLNVLANELGQVSPYTPPPGFSCAK